MPEFFDDPQEPRTAPRSGPAPVTERQLLEVLLAEPELVPEALQHLTSADVTHPGLRKIYQCLGDMHRDGEPIDMDALRARLNQPAMADAARELQERGQKFIDRPRWLTRVVAQIMTQSHS